METEEKKNVVVETTEKVTKSLDNGFEIGRGTLGFPGGVIGGAVGGVFGTIRGTLGSLLDVRW